MTDSDFNRRRGGYSFSLPSGPMHNWTAMVQEWSDRSRIPIQWHRSQSGPANALTFVQVPIIGGVVHHEYAGQAHNAQAAKNVACERIARSGHC